MTIRREGDTLFFQRPPVLEGWASVAGKKEANGPLGKEFDILCMDSRLGQKSFEKAEAKLQNVAVSRALQKAGLESGSVDFILGGDLLNQCIGSSYGLRDFGIPFLGLYGACSTMAESMGLAAVLCASGAAGRCCAVSSSHFCSAERQFRFPLNYGGLRTPTAQWTVTGAGAVLVGDGDKKGPVSIRSVTFGRMEDLGITDINNMGAAMAPAAARTIGSFFADTGSSPTEFDLILTGDLGFLGSELMLRLLLQNGLDIRAQHADCGMMIYERRRQDVHCGGSGCGCSASVLCSGILRSLSEGRLHRILFIATGALMSTLSVQQGESIPAIAHLLQLTAGGEV